MKKFYLFILLLFSVNNQVVAESSLMKLFYTPAERAEIDAARDASEKNKSVQIKKQQTRSVEVKGYLRRQGQTDVVWLNSENTLKSNKPLSDVKVLKVQKDGKVKIRINGKGVVKVKPGQVVTRGQSSVQESYETKQ